MLPVVFKVDKIEISTTFLVGFYLIHLTVTDSLFTAATSHNLRETFQNEEYLLLQVTFPG